jgi:hypothetical protein
VTQVVGPRRRLEELHAALQRRDIPAARSALEAYNGEWNGIEVYVNFRSRALYGEIETHYESDITTALESANPDPAAILPLVRGMVAQYDEAIKLSDTGPAISPLFEDVAAVRIVRAPLRNVVPALKANDLTKAKAAFDAFKARWGEAHPYFSARSAQAVKDIDAALAQADRAMSAPPINANEAAPLVTDLMDRYNFGVNLLNAAARNADLTKSAATDPDVKSAATLGAIQQDLATSLSLWEGSNHRAAGDLAHRTLQQRFESVASALKAKAGADAPVRKALEAYAAVAGQPGDASAVRSAQRAAVEAVAIGQQALVGQFWTDTAFKEAYERALKAA